MDCPETLRQRCRRSRHSRHAQSPLRQCHLPIDAFNMPAHVGIGTSELDLEANGEDELARTKHEWRLDQARLLAVTNLDFNYCTGKSGKLLVTYEADDSADEDAIDNYLGLSHPDEWVREHAKMRYDYAAGRTREIESLTELIAEKDMLLAIQEKELEKLRSKLNAMRGILHG